MFRVLVQGARVQEADPPYEKNDPQQSAISLLQNSLKYSWFSVSLTGGRDF